MEQALSVLLWILAAIVGMWAVVFFLVILFIIGGLIYVVTHD